MAASTSHIGVEPGDGLVGRFGETVLLVAGPVAGDDPFVEDLVATVEAGVSDAALPGAALAHRVGELLFGAESGEAASFAVVAPVEGGALVLLHGQVDAEISRPSGVRRLSGRQAVTWVDQVVKAPLDQVVVTGGDTAAVSVHPRSDLQVGVVPGGGFVMTPGEAVPQQVRVASADAGPDVSSLRPTAATEVPAPPAEDEVVLPTAASRGTAPPFDQSAEMPAAETEPAQGAGLTTPRTAEPEAGPGGLPEYEPVPGRLSDYEPGGAGGGGLPEEAEGPAGPSRSAAATMAATGAPSELVAEDGSRTPLDGTYVVGREPGADEAVRSREASPLQIDDPDQLVSRVHAHLWVDRGAVFVRDAHSANGTFVAAPGAKDWTRVDDEGAELPVGWSMRLGGRVFILEQPTG
jgi:hypothetical protein